jgi:acyl-CoA synthetase (NDP forming)
MTTSEKPVNRKQAASLEEILHPRGVAVVGVSPNQPGFAGVGLGFLLAPKEIGHPAAYAVNPNYDEIEGLKCYASVLDIEGPVDHVVSSVPARIVPKILEDCIAKGVRSIQMFTAGFSETEDEEMTLLEQQIVSRANEGGIRIFGPNCMGLYVPEAKLSWMSGAPAEPGPVGYLSQSGGNMGEMVMVSTVRGIRYSKAVSYGNAADVDESELMEHLADDPKTEVIAAYIEGVKDGRRFFEATRRAAAVKPVIVLKGGRTEAGTRAVKSHTASLAGAYDVFKGMCMQVNAVNVTSVEELADMVVAFRFMGVPAGPRVGIVGVGGGMSVFAADQLIEAGLECPAFPEQTQAELREFIAVAGTSVQNPLDAIQVFEPRALERTLTAVGKAENIDVMIYPTGLPSIRRRSASLSSAAGPEDYVNALVRAREASGTPIVVVVRPPLDTAGMEMAAPLQKKFWEAGFPVFTTVPRAANAIAKMLRWRQNRPD